MSPHSKTLAKDVAQLVTYRCNKKNSGLANSQTDLNKDAPKQRTSKKQNLALVAAGTGRGFLQADWGVVWDIRQGERTRVPLTAAQASIGR